jgi:hypothetical protein
MLTVVLGQNLLANGVKLLVRRERPPVVPPLAPGTGYSYPSGHTTAAAATYAAMALLLGRGRRWPVRVWLAVAAVGVTVCVALSRVLLGFHWLTDVIGGAALGFGWFVVCSVAFGGALLHFGAPAERVEAEEARLSGVEQPRTRGAHPMPDPEPSPEQVDRRAGSLAAEPGNAAQDPDAQARALLEESEERVEDPAARDPDDQGVIRRQSGEGVTAD